MVLRTRHWVRRLAPVAASVALLLAGCGDDSGGGSQTDTTADADGTGEGDTQSDVGGDTGKLDADTGGDPDVDAGGGGDTDVGQSDADTTDLDADVEEPDVDADADADADVDADADADADVEDPDADATDPDADATDPDADATGPDADTTGPDGGTGGDSYEVVDCGEVNWTEVPAGKTCVTESGSTTLLVRGTILGRDSVWLNGEMLVDGSGTISCVGCSCTDFADPAVVTVITCPDAVVSPGLINTHDHITFTQSYPGEWGDTRYDHRHEWRTGANQKPEIQSLQNFYSKGESWGEMRMVMSGVTSTVGAGGEDGFLRNLDRDFQLEGISWGEVELATFPLGDASGTLKASGCSYNINKTKNPFADLAYHAHVSEGVNVFANNEFLCLSGQQAGGVEWIGDTISHIHGIGLTAPDIATMAGSGTGLIWSPRTNISLYGHTATVPLYDQLGVMIGLGTDWVRSGSMNMLRELHCADEYNTTYLDAHFSDKAIFDMATYNNARLSEFHDFIGSLEAGKVGDFAIYAGDPSLHYRAVLEAEIEDVALVVRGGRVQYGDAAVVGGMPFGGASDCESLDVCGVSKSLCIQRELGMSLAQFQSAQANGPYPVYPLFFCGVPTSEPTCTPLRVGEYDGIPTAEDLDGDGIANEIDNCPTVFNAPRPMDGGQQPNIDGDALGDACDPCPFDAGSDTCGPIDPNDLDGDGVPNEIDNCPKDANPDQEDLDDDGKGDACDPCPEFPNPGNLGCPTTVYDIRTGVVASGTNVVVQDVIVTAQKDLGFFVQTPADSTAYDGPEFSAVYVYNQFNDFKPAVGDRLTIAASVGDFFGQIQLSNAFITVLSSGNALPAPALVQPADVATGGALAAAYENVLVRIENVLVTELAPATPENQPTNEFAVTGGLIINDFFYLIAPTPSVGDSFDAIQGVMRFDWNNLKLEPRNAGDVDLGPPGLVSFSGENAYIFEETTGPATPELMVAISSVAEEAIFVEITSSAPSVLAVVDGGVTVAVGQTGAAVTLVAGSVDASQVVTLTAHLGPVDLTVDVLVVDADAVPSVVTISPKEQSVGVSDIAEFVVSIDVPAPAGGTEVLVEIDGPAGTSAPSSVTIAEGEFSAVLEVQTSATSGFVEIEVSLTTGEFDSAVLQVVDIPLVGLVLVEVYYDNPASDDGMEWVKLFNGTPASVDLSGYSIGHGGTDYTHGTLQLSGTVAAGACFLVGGPTSSAENGNPVYDLAINFTPDIQNSGATADGVALFQVPAASIGASTVPIDAVVFGTTNTNNLLGPDGAPKAVDVGDAPAGQSLLRTSTGWIISPTPNAVACPSLTAP